MNHTTENMFSRSPFADSGSGGHQREDPNNSDNYLCSEKGTVEDEFTIDTKTNTQLKGSKRKLGALKLGHDVNTKRIKNCELNISDTATREGSTESFFTGNNEKNMFFNNDIRVESVPVEVGNFSNTASASSSHQSRMYEQQCREELGSMGMRPPHVMGDDAMMSRPTQIDEKFTDHIDFEQSKQASQSVRVNSRSPASPSQNSALMHSFGVKNRMDTMLMSIDRCYRQVAMISVLVWMTLTCASFYAGIKKGNLEQLTGSQKQAPMIAANLLGASIVATLLPYAVRGKTKHFSGIIVCALTVQCTALVTDLMLAYYPTPVFIDPVCGTRVYLLRWCEWTPLAFVMTFLAESCKTKGKSNLSQMTSFFGTVNGADDHYHTDHPGISSNNTAQAVDNGPTEKVPKAMAYSRQVTREFLAPAYRLAWTQGLSTFCGLLFPFCPGIKSWSIVLIISCLLYFAMFYRLHERQRTFSRLKKPKSVGEQEMYEWARLSLGLLKVCTGLWTTLVFTFFFYSFGPLLFPRNMFLTGKALSMICESIVDVLFKSIYMLVITDVHDCIFDQGLRAERRLQEMSQMMSAVWSNSSDIICISVKNNNGVVTTMLSPTYLKMYEKEGKDSEEEVLNKASAIAFDLNEEQFCDKHFQSKKGSPIDMAKLFAPEHVYQVDFGTESEAVPSKVQTVDEDIGSIAELVVKAWNAKKDETLLMHNLIRTKGDSQKILFQCEASISKMEKNAVLIVVRDISERCKRFEAEKKVISESTARMKDAAANRFTRHEVKNGLLAAIGLCDSLRESSLLENNNAAFHAHFASKIEDLRKQGYLPDDEGIMATGSRNLCRYLFELDKTLHEILDTILADAMARDVIHEVYEPKLERVNLPKLLNSTMNLTSDSQNIKRFPISTNPNPLPRYALDPQLLKYIHRNAISNACKYGKCGGEIRTEVHWNQMEGTLTMQVINLPGPKHEEILRLGDVASEIVFSPRRRLAIHSETADRTVSHSSGDGAWIMHKCAKTLGGSCDIKFEKASTTFTFTCPVTPYSATLALQNVSYEDFEMPKNIWGIALDDSKIQRKLLLRFFMYAGIPAERSHIKGATTKEIKEFDTWAVNFIDEHSDDYFLMIIDENLDVQEEDDATSQITISGSLAISKMRKRLQPDQERRVLALIRSANDSASDVAIYNSRAHGFLPKAPIKKDSLREVLVPMWLTRFPAHKTSHKSSGKRAANLEMGAETFVTITDIMPCINDIDALASLPQHELVERWNILWEKLHALKGDLLIMPAQARIGNAVNMISSLRGPLPPDNLNETWQSLRSSLLMVETME